MKDKAIPVPLTFVLDVGGSSLKANVCDRSLSERSFILDEDLVFDIDASGDHQTILTGFEKLFYYLLLETQSALHKEISIEGIALAFPGPCDYQEGIPLMRGLDKYEALYGEPLFPALRQVLEASVAHLNGLKEGIVQVASDLNMTMQNDARMYAYGSWTENGRIADQRIAFLTLGTGLGSAFIVNGELLTDDADRNRAEGLPEDGYIYHLPCAGTSADDCLSTRGLIALAAGRGLDVHNGLELAELADSGNHEAIDSFLDFGRVLSDFIDSSEGLGRFRPDLVYLGGNLALATKRMNLQTQTRVEEQIDSRYPLIGAAAYHMDYMKTRERDEQ